MNPGFQFEVIWNDNDSLKLRATAWNGAFGGVADVYVGMHELRETAIKLSGFPNCPTDTREITLGAFGPEFAGGAISMRFYCADGSGHAYVESRVESDGYTAGIVQSAVLVLPVEAAAVDAFVDELHRVDADNAGTARLAGAIASEGR